MDAVTLIGRASLIILCSYFTYSLLTSPRPFIFIDYANLFIHEGGHFLFTFLGQFLYMLGGSMVQIVLPCGFFVYFLIKKSFFASSVMLFWIADNIINVSVYMKDAIAMQLPLLGGASIHDWNWIFGQLNLLPASVVIGSVFFYLGVFCAFASIIAMILFTLSDLRMFYHSPHSLN